MESYDKLLAEEIFFIKLQSGGILPSEDIAGKECLVICAMGGVGLWRKIYAQAVEESLMQAGAAKCDHIVLFNSDDLDSLCDLTDVEQAVGTSRYDYIIVLGGMEKTRDSFKRCAARAGKFLWRHELRRNSLHGMRSMRMRMYGVMMRMTFPGCLPDAV